MKGLFYRLTTSQDEESFVFQERGPVPSPSEYHVKLQVKACALTPINTKLISALYQSKEFVPVGRDVAGIILEVGPKVSFFKPDDEVVGILPLDFEESGLCDVIWVHEHHLVHKPDKVSCVEAAGTIRDGLCVYTALHSLAHLAQGKFVLVLDGASPFGTLAIQLSHHRGATVVTTAHSEEDKQYLDKIRPPVARVIDVSKSNVNLTEKGMEETGGLGFDIILDAGAVLYNTEDSVTKPKLLPHKHEIISLLAVGGHWVTKEQYLQLDPPDSNILFLKSASLSYLNEETWNLSSSHQGKYLHILKDVMDKLGGGIFKPYFDEQVPMYEAKVFMEMVQRKEVKKRLVVQL
ncbi:quinone oxidoreductase-like protein 1 [Hyla sarda]|uniref:quinone oxidoreductase-like protein 1 n=1 Tax=Hyla sarda TaxID=327740 RepID=UPI0024C3B545|nr:quinone oxidoreductase-like protein 1 [Hyla sarda]XP_056415540.1 quinone oxidoreductase-like protein 1 [Hyla sarda]XP_056415541.1 quinone oxidoreductase-like protein 1 [Hyla sarda]XP_056415543.1 quinone oxidoreductase-like protein 1 [Hyla sarda]XP_056415544.1 quinone oxidoreductase-like protein 1 [Hyla sarda]